MNPTLHTRLAEPELGAVSAQATREMVQPSKRAHPVVVASDGSPEAEALFSAARVSAAALGTSIEVLGVCEPTPLTPALGGGVLAAPDLDAMRRRTMLTDVQRAISVATNGDPEWPVDVVLGPPATVLAREAERRGASLMVMGIGRHNPLDRLLGTETTLATLRRVRLPVLAVGTTFSRPPQNVVIGMDFSPASKRAAALAVRLLGQSGRATLVHVRPRFDHPSSDWRVWDQEYSRSLAPLFAETIAQLGAPSSVRVDTVTVRGEPASALLSYAQQVHADLLAIGTQRHGVLERLLVGSVATRVIRNARIATLAAPTPLVAGPAGLAPEGARVESSEDPAAWPALLDAFSKANRGRVAVLESGPEASALQPVASDMLFDGVSADAHARQVHLLLRGSGGATDHITHADDDVERVAIVRDAMGVDLGLRLRHAAGVTRLSFL